MVGRAPVVTRDVAPGVHMVTHGFTNCFVVEDDEGVTLVDACFPSTWPAVRACLQAGGRSVSDVRGLVLTHGHFDHVGFAYFLQRQHGVPVWAHRGDLPILAHPYRYDPERPRLLHPLTHRASWPVLGAMVAAGALRVPGVAADHVVDGRMVLELPGRPELIPTPGHTDGECVLHLPGRGALITGDALVTLDPYTGHRGPRVVARAATHDSRLALDSLRGLRDLDASTVLPGHGEIWRDGVGAAVDAALVAGAA